MHVFPKSIKTFQYGSDSFPLELKSVPSNAEKSCIKFMYCKELFTKINNDHKICP